MGVQLRLLLPGFRPFVVGSRLVGLSKLVMAQGQEIVVVGGRGAPSLSQSRPMRDSSGRNRARSHTVAKFSQAATARRKPSGWKAKQLTKLFCGGKSNRWRKVRASQRATLRSIPAVARSLLS